MESKLLFFTPEFKTLIWGGTKMKDMLGMDIPSDNTGEDWAISAHKNGDCAVLDGEFKGQRLSSLWKNHRELFGNFASESFPLLVKIIDAKKDLSIQVHPDNEYARAHENGATGKTECWYILDCDENSKLIVGHNAKTRDELCKLIDERKFSELIREVPIKKGDFVRINPGTVHSIKGGVMLLEIQQNSDITYRVYDYDRLCDGKLRELHIKESKEVITVPAPKGVVRSTSNEAGLVCLEDCGFYSVEKLVVDGSFVLSNSETFRTVSCVEGSGTVGNVTVKKGDNFIIPANCNDLCIEGKLTFIMSQAKE